MKTEISYAHLDRRIADDKAIADCLEYLSPKQWATLQSAINDPSTPISRLNIYFGFVGIEGYPFHAMMRRLRLDDYRAWMMSDEGGDPVMVDEFGYTIKEAQAA